MPYTLIYAIYKKFPETDRLLVLPMGGVELGSHSNQLAVELGIQSWVESGNRGNQWVELGTPGEVAEEGIADSQEDRRQQWVEPDTRDKVVEEAGTPWWGRRGFVGEGRVAGRGLGGVAEEPERADRMRLETYSTG